MTKNLKDRIRRAAEIDRRSMANWCVAQLEKAVESLEAGKSSGDQPSMVAGLQALNSPRKSSLSTSAGGAARRK